MTMTPNQIDDASRLAAIHGASGIAAIVDAWQAAFPTLLVETVEITRPISLDPWETDTIAGARIDGRFIATVGAPAIRLYATPDILQVEVTDP